MHYLRTAWAPRFGGDSHFGGVLVVGAASLG